MQTGFCRRRQAFKVISWASSSQDQMISVIHFREIHSKDHRTSFKSSLFFEFGGDDKGLRSDLVCEGLLKLGSETPVDDFRACFRNPWLKSCVAEGLSNHDQTRWWWTSGSDTFSSQWLLRFFFSCHRLIWIQNVCNNKVHRRSTTYLLTGSGLRQRLTTKEWNESVNLRRL